MANKKKPTSRRDLPEANPEEQVGRKVNIPYGPRNRVQTKVLGDSLTKSEFAGECQIENIVEKFTRTGQLTHLSQVQPQYGEAPAIEFHEALLAAKQAQENFENLPTNIVEKFGGDPARFVEFCENASAAELADLGLIDLPDQELGEKPTQAPTEPSATEVAPDSGSDG